MTRLFLLSFFAGFSAFAHYDDCDLTLAPEIEVDRLVRTTSNTVGLSSDELLRMIRDNLVMAVQTDHPSGVVGEIYARSPKDHLVYEIDFVHNADFQIQRLVDFSQAREPMFSRFDFIKMEEINQKRERSKYNRAIEDLRREMGEDFAKPSRFLTPPKPRNDNFVQAARVQNRNSVFHGAQVGFERATEPEAIRMAKGALENTSSVGLPWTPSAAFDVNVPFDLSDRRLKTYLISPTEMGHIFVILRSERGSLICEHVAVAEPEEHKDFLCKVAQTGK
jgi:hypothetical protein